MGLWPYERGVHADGDGYQYHSDRYAHTYADSYRYHSDPYPYAHANPNSNSHTDFYPYDNANADGYRYHSHTRNLLASDCQVSDAYSNVYAHFYIHSNRDTHANSSLRRAARQWRLRDR